ncbi:MAG: DUF1653 domain-containing protein [Saprospiraceae bacterium]|nr:DUF1653 domain-containing protein [Saprospiraceae bacterium]
MPIPTGVYRHFKGRFYLVLGEAQHSETNEEMVVYQPLYGEPRWFVRPLSMFTEAVEHEGQRKARFAYAGPATPP